MVSYTVRQGEDDWYEVGLGFDDRWEVNAKFEDLLQAEFWCKFLNEKAFVTFTDRGADR